MYTLVFMFFKAAVASFEIKEDEKRQLCQVGNRYHFRFSLTRPFLHMQVAQASGLVDAIKLNLSTLNLPCYFFLFFLPTPFTKSSPFFLYSQVRKRLKCSWPMRRWWRRFFSWIRWDKRPLSVPLLICVCVFLFLWYN